MYIRIYQNIKKNKKTCCIKIVPTDQSNIIYVEKNKISKT